MNRIAVIIILVSAFWLLLWSQGVSRNRCEDLGGAYHSRVVYGGAVSLCLSPDGRVLDR